MILCDFDDLNKEDLFKILWVWLFVKNIELYVKEILQHPDIILKAMENFNIDKDIVNFIKI